MSDEQEDDASLPQKALRTVSPGVVGRPDREMDAIGWGLFLGLLVLLLPLLPALVIVYGISKLLEAVAER